MSDTVKIKIWISTNRVGSTCEDTVEIPSDVWDDMDDEQKKEFCREIAFQNMDWSFEVE